MSELIREKLFVHLRQEVPYGVAVVIEDFEQREAREGQERGVVAILARIIVKRDPQRGIVIGKGGGMLKRVGTEARADIRLLGTRVHLDMHVSVRKDWTITHGCSSSWAWSGPPRTSSNRSGACSPSSPSWAGPTSAIDHFNRLIGKQQALVDDRPGVTGTGTDWQGQEVVVVDAGFEPDPSALDEDMFRAVRRSAEVAIEADVVIFLVDRAAGITPADRSPQPPPPADGHRRGRISGGQQVRWPGHDDDGRVLGAGLRRDAVRVRGPRAGVYELWGVFTGSLTESAASTSPRRTTARSASRSSAANVEGTLVNRLIGEGRQVRHAGDRQTAWTR